MINKFNKLIVPKRFLSFGVSEEVASSRSKLSKLDKTNTAAQPSKPSVLSNERKTLDKNNYIHEPAEFSIQKRAYKNAFDVNEEDVKPINNYIDGEQSSQNDMRMINYKSKLGIFNIHLDLIVDTYEWVKFLNLIHYNAMENWLSIFREDIFNNEKRNEIVNKFINVLNKDLPKVQLSRFTKKQIWEIAERIIQSLTVIMEFMDKGIKGLLTGDLTIYMLQKIEATLEKLYNKLTQTSKELESLLLKREEAHKLYNVMQGYQSLSSNAFNFNSKGEKINSKNVYLPSIGIDIPMSSNDLNSIIQNNDNNSKKIY